MESGESTFEILEKTKRYGEGPAKMVRLIGGRGLEIGSGAIIDIRLFEDRGLKLAGPLPPQVQHWTT